MQLALCPFDGGLVPLFVVSKMVKHIHMKVRVVTTQFLQKHQEISKCLFLPLWGLVTILIQRDVGVVPSTQRRSQVPAPEEEIPILPFIGKLVAILILIAGESERDLIHQRLHLRISGQHQLIPDLLLFFGRFPLEEECFFLKVGLRELIVQRDTADPIHCQSLIDPELPVNRLYPPVVCDFHGFATSSFAPCRRRQ